MLATTLCKQMHVTACLVVLAVTVLTVNTATGHTLRGNLVGDRKPYNDMCITCIFVLERLRLGTNSETVCSEVRNMAEKRSINVEEVMWSYTICEEIVTSLSVWGDSVHSWQTEGCFKSEEYGTMERIAPCPPHVICSQLAPMKTERFSKLQENMHQHLGLGFCNRVGFEKFNEASAFVDPQVNAKRPSPNTDSNARCMACIYVLEMIKRGSHYLLPSICDSLVIDPSKGYTAAERKLLWNACQATVTSLATFGSNVRSWIHNGCYKLEAYGSMEHVTPCPTHAICAEILDEANKGFCEMRKVLKDSDGAASKRTEEGKGT